jgi:hypothetical protein
VVIQLIFITEYRPGAIMEQDRTPTCWPSLQCLHVIFWKDGFSIARVNEVTVLHQLLPTVCLNAVTTYMAFHRLELWVSSHCDVYGKQIYNVLDCELYIGRGGNWVTWDWYSPRRTKLIVFMFCQYVSSIIPLTLIEIHFVNFLQSSNYLYADSPH